ncbi:putative reverse transcriptase zinc-binding domain-containing protein [Helianthus annuus]|nr:putative reverse transcriptase zinc-binding domain-containing protein [Helianthus annuus]
MVDFSLKQVRHELVERSNSRGDLNQFICSKIVVLKVNCFVWKATTRKITTAMWPWRPFGDGSCLMCGIVNEKVDHFLVECSFVKSVWWLVCRWLKVPIPNTFSSVDLSTKAGGSIFKILAGIGRMALNCPCEEDLVNSASATTGRKAQVKGKRPCVENLSSASLNEIPNSASATTGTHSFGWIVKHIIKIS